MINGQDSLIFGERIFVVLRVGKQISDAKLQVRTLRKSGGQSDEFGLGLWTRVITQQHLDQCEPGVEAVGFGVRLPDSVNGVVVILQNSVERMLASSQARKSTVHVGVLRRLFPKTDQIAFGFVGASGVAQGAGEL